MATERGTPRRSKARTAVRRRSWRVRPATPAALHAVAQAFLKSSRRVPAKRPVRLVSRAGKDHRRRFADLVAAIRALPPATLILDGEVAIFDDQLISRFEWFRKRPEDVASTPPIYMAFDCLYVEGRDLRALPLGERRRELEAIVENDHTLIFPARRLPDNGFEAWKQVVERGYEGLVAKDDTSPYVGGRTLKWLKVRQRDHRAEERGWDSRSKS